MHIHRQSITKVQVHNVVSLSIKITEPLASYQKVALACMNYNIHVCAPLTQCTSYGLGSQCRVTWVVSPTPFSGSFERVCVDSNCLLCVPLLKIQRRWTSMSYFAVHPKRGLICVSVRCVILSIMDDCEKQYGWSPNYMQWLLNGYY